MRGDSVWRPFSLGSVGRKSAAEGRVDYLFHRLMAAVNLFFHQDSNVGLEGERGPHGNIMMPRNQVVKMLYELQFGRVGEKLE